MNSHGSPKFSSPNARGGSRRAPSTLAHPENPFLLGTAVAVELYFVLGLHVGVSLLIAALLVLRFKIHFLKIAIMVNCCLRCGGAVHATAGAELDHSRRGGTPARY
jgi:hypothetical protein